MEVSWLLSMVLICLCCCCCHEHVPLLLGALKLTAWLCVLFSLTFIHQVLPALCFGCLCEGLVLLLMALGLIVQLCVVLPAQVGNQQGRSKKHGEYVNVCVLAVRSTELFHLFVVTFQSSCCLNCLVIHAFPWILYFPACSAFIFVSDVYMQFSPRG